MKYKTKKDLSASREKEIKENLLELEKYFSILNKYFDYDDAEYRRIKDVKDLFNFSIDEDCYKPIITKDSFNNSHIQYESMGDKEKNLSVDKYFDRIKPYLRDIINNQ